MSEKEEKKGKTYPKSVGGVDYVEYQLCWIIKKKLRSKSVDYINKQRAKYLKYITLFDDELTVRNAEEIKKKQDEEQKEKDLLESLMKKYNKV